MWLTFLVLAMVVTVALGGLLVVQPQLAAAAISDQDRASVEASNLGQAAVLEQLRQDFEGIDELKAQLMPLGESVPSGTDMPAFVNQLDALAGTSQVTLTGITVADAVPYASVGAAAVATPAAESGSTSTEPVAPVAGAPPVTSSQITAANFASLEVTVDVTGSYGNALNFISGLQTGKRLFLVTGYSTASAADGAGEATTDVVATITGLVYVLVQPDTAATAAVATE